MVAATTRKGEGLRAMSSRGQACKDDGKEVALPEQVGGAFAAAEVFEGFGGELAASGGAVQVAGLQEEGFVHVFERGFFFADRGGQGFGAYRAAVEFFEDGQEDFAVHFIESRVVHAQPVQRLLRHLGGNDALGLDVGEVPDAPDEPVGDARGPARAPADFLGAARFDGDVQQAVPTG